jgi:hypothetical protein
MQFHQIASFNAALFSRACGELFAGRSPLRARTIRTPLTAI